MVQSVSSATEKELRVPFVDLVTQHAELQAEIEEAAASVMRRASFILGPDVSGFEEEFATYCGADHAIGVDSGTSALELILRAYEIGPGDEVITVANTFVATALAIAFTGATPVLVDIDPETYTMDPALLEEAITPRTRAIMPVHLYGQPADMDPILTIAEKHGLLVIEDACQAHGAEYKGRRAGSIGHAAGFSFYPSKNLGAYGDGGMIVTSDDAVAEAVKMLRNYGTSQKYKHEIIGYNRRLDTVHAAVLRVKLRHLDDWNAARRSHAKLYNELLTDARVSLPVVADYALPVWHLYVIRVADRVGLQDYLNQRNISSGIHYPIPVHLQPAFEYLGYAQGRFPITERYAEQIVSLPMYPELSSEMIEYAVGAIKEYVNA